LLLESITSYYELSHGSLFGRFVQIK